MAQILWEKRENEQAFKQKREKQKESGFHHIDRDLTKRERRNYPFAIIMTHAVHGEVIVPDLLRCPLRKVSYLDLIPKILAANPSKDLKTPVLHELWDAILSKVYDYEYDWREDKKHEVGFPSVALARQLTSYSPLIQAQSAASNNHLNPFADSSRSKKRKHSDVEQPSVETEAPLAKKKAPPSSLNAHNPPKKHSALEHRHFSLALRPRPQQSNEIPEPMHIEQSQQGITQLQNDRSLDPRPEDG